MKTIRLKATLGGRGLTGPAAWLPVMAWSGSANYVSGPPASLVTFGGGTYVCIAANTNKQPDTNSAFWTLVAAPGTNGLVSVPIVDRFDSEPGPFMLTEAPTKVMLVCFGALVQDPEAAIPSYSISGKIFTLGAGVNYSDYDFFLVIYI